jgi:hypothetical protein
MAQVEIGNLVYFYAGGRISEYKIYAEMWVLDKSHFTILDLPPSDASSSENSINLAAAIAVPVVGAVAIAGAVFAYLHWKRYGM